jgi:hypothetical protein
MSRKRLVRSGCDRRRIVSTSPVSYKRHRFPPQIIAHAVWLHFRFPLSLRLVEELLLERGIAVAYETIRRWGKKSRPDFARLRRKTPSGNDVWHLDEVVIAIAGRKHWLWRAVDQDGYVRPDMPQHQGCQAIADPPSEEAGHRTQADDHGQVALLWSSPATGHATRRTPISQGSEQPSREFSCAAAEARADDARLPNTGAFSASSLSSPLSVTSSSHPAHNAPHSKAAFIASRRSQNGKVRPEP